MGNSHKNLLLRNHWDNCNQSFVEWSLDGPLPKLCPVIPTSNQDGRQAKNRKKGDEIKKKSSPLKLLSQSQPNFAEMILDWSPFKIVPVSAVLYPRWPPILKIEISSNGQNCSILSQKVPKFELYMMSFLTYITGFFYELWTFAYFDRLCKLEKGGMKF